MMLDADETARPIFRAGDAEHGGTRGQPTKPRRWFAPWLAPVALGAPYVAQLWREVGGDLPGLLLQVAFAVPLVVAGTVLGMKT